MKRRKQMMKRIVATLTLFLSISNYAYAQGFIPFEDKDTKLFGIKDARGKVLIKPQFQIVMGSGNISDALIAVYKNGNWYRMDRKGNLKFETVYLDNGPDYYQEGLTRFIKDRKIGFHDQSGQVIVQPAYDFAAPFKQGHALVCNGCWAAYPENPKFSPLVSSFCDRNLRDEYKSIVGGKWGAVNLKGELVVPVNYASSEEVFERLDPKKK
jgi:hypothetical protein